MKKKISHFAKVVIYLLIALQLVACAKKSSDKKNELKRTQATGLNNNAPNLSTARTINPSGSNSALAYAQNQQASMEWLGSYSPIQSNSGNEIVVVNVIRINGEEFELPTYQVTAGSEDSWGRDAYSLDDLNVDTESVCMDRNCINYVLSIIVSRGGSPIIQNLVYVDFADRVEPIRTIKQGNQIATLTEFIDYIESYF